MPIMVEGRNETERPYQPIGESTLFGCSLLSCVQWHGRGRKAVVWFVFLERVFGCVLLSCVCVARCKLFQPPTRLQDSTTLTHATYSGFGLTTHVLSALWDCAGSHNSLSPAETVVMHVFGEHLFCVSVVPRELPKCSYGHVLVLVWEWKTKHPANKPDVPKDIMPSFQLCA